ncbi:DUF6642 family protein [Flavobacterium crassostreae]|uniref:Uncharacterized protein n=1 Tax=Flavobacterium crassostreae TaxID=1763534 RepID=A0A1B9DKI5_9FLAO|nr:DUF6642 family protein [Flavobacterium crassostreae]OCB70226.1 hypothetical protein LPBF_12350 [Flavobacterium crassostreae]
MDSIERSNYNVPDHFIFCLECVTDINQTSITPTRTNLEQLATKYNLTSIYKSCDTIEGLEDSLNALLYRDHDFKNYEILYLVLQGQANTICINAYYYTLEEIAELFEGKLTGKILHFANSKTLDLEPDEAQYFLDITGAKAISGYGVDATYGNSNTLDALFFSLFSEQDNIVDLVETLFQKNYTLCKLLDFRLYY